MTEDLNLKNLPKPSRLKKVLGLRVVVHFPTVHACEQQESFTLLLDQWDVIPMLKILGLIVPCAFFSFIKSCIFCLSKNLLSALWSTSLFVGFLVHSCVFLSFFNSFKEGFNSFFLLCLGSLWPFLSFLGWQLSTLIFWLIFYKVMTSPHPFGPRPLGLGVQCFHYHPGLESFYFPFFFPCLKPS